VVMLATLTAPEQYSIVSSHKFDLNISVPEEHNNAPSGVPGSGLKYLGKT